MATLTKSSLRSACIARRDAIPAPEHEAWSFSVCERLMHCFSQLPLTTQAVALYNPIKSELDITPVLHALYAEGITVALPVVEGGSRQLGFYRFFSQLPMDEGAFGIREPQHVEAVTPDIVIVPLVGFDRHGNRLGYGKGYYDATLAMLRASNLPLLAIGVAFAMQEVESIPADSHDARLNMIITEKEGIVI